MNVVDTRKQMQACVEALREKLPSVRGASRRSKAIQRAHRDVLRMHKAFLHALDMRGSEPPFKTILLWGTVPMSDGIRRELERVTAEALAEIEAIGTAAEVGDAPADE